MALHKSLCLLQLENLTNYPLVFSLHSCVLLLQLGLSVGLGHQQVETHFSGKIGLWESQPRMLVVPKQSHVGGVQSLFYEQSILSVLLLVYQIGILESHYLVHPTGLSEVELEFISALFVHLLCEAKI